MLGHIMEVISLVIGSIGVRYHLGSYLLIGLEFLIAADIIHSVFKPDLKSLTVLGPIVAFRLVISFYLNKALKYQHLYCPCREQPLGAG